MFSNKVNLIQKAIKLLCFHFKIINLKNNNNLKNLVDSELKINNSNNNNNLQEDNKQIIVEVV